jgi:DNA repair exonuclease SbcCD ATPase subunit
MVIGIFPITRVVFASEENGDDDNDDDDDDEHDYLAEILAEEQKEAEELAQLEAQMRELDELKAQQHQRQKQDQQTKQNQFGQMPPGGTMGGKKKMMPGGTNKKFQSIEEELRKKESEAQESKQEENKKNQEEAEKRKAEQIAQEREAAFQAEMERAKDEKTRKDLKRQKAKDAKIVSKILKNSTKGNHYAVLGLRCQWGEIKIGPFKFCSPKNGEIKRAYRNMARLVHPDKNRDGRAGQAFDLLETSSSILLDEKTRKEYDQQLKVQRKHRVEKSFQMFDDTLNTIIRILSTMKAILGPFATPIIVLTALII